VIRRYPAARGALQTRVTHALSITQLKDDNYTTCGKRLPIATWGSGSVFRTESQ